MLAKTAGVKHLIVLINKMDDATVNWAETRYNECKDKLVPYLKKVSLLFKHKLFLKFNQIFKLLLEFYTYIFALIQTLNVLES